MPEGCAVVAADPREVVRAAWSQEAALVEHAVPKRRNEFLVGRNTARQALARLGVETGAILADPDRLPIWPEGVVGSISHCDTACAAVVAQAEDWASIGVDLEEDTPLDGDLVPTICNDEEQMWMGGLNADVRLHRAKLIFCIKEAAFKAQYPLSRAMFGFHHLHVSVNEADATFEARFQETAGRFQTGDVIAGRYAHAAGYIVAGAALKAKHHVDQED